MLAKYPDLDGEKKRGYLVRAISAGLESEVIELGKKKGDHNSKGRRQELFFNFGPKGGVSPKLRGFYQIFLKLFAQK